MRYVQMLWCGAVRLATWLIMLGVLVGMLTIRGHAWAAKAIGWPVGNERLWGAVAAGNLEEVHRAWDEGAIAETQDDETGHTLLLVAASGSSPELLRELLAHRATPDAAGPLGITPLHLAVCNGRIENVRVLLDWGADPNRMTTWQITPLISAVRCGREPIVRLLLERGAGMAVGGRRVLVEAAESESAGPGLLARLIAAGADVNGADARGVTPYQAARQAGRQDMLAVLLQHGARPEVAPGQEMHAAAGHSGWPVP